MSFEQDGRWYETYFGPDYLKIDFHPDTEREVEFLRTTFGLGRGSRVLDIGCGYGRHLVPLARRGVRVCGCDLSRFMLDTAATRIREASREKPEILKKTGLVRCDFRELPFLGDFDCAMIMFNTFGYFAGEDDNFRVLTAAARALKPGGLLLLDQVNRDFVVRHMSRKDWFEHEDSIILEKKRFDPVAGRTEIDVSVVDKRGKRDYHHSIRVYSYTEMGMLLEAAGFRIVAVFGGFGGEDFELNRDRMLILSQSLELEDE